MSGAKKRDLLSLADLTSEELQGLLDLALALKREPAPSARLRGKSLALVFEKPSLRTRVSFDVAMYQLGGHALYLGAEEVGFGKREPLSDMARTLSRYVDGIVARTFAHKTVEELARHATVPVINGLSDQEHPCQALADVLTILECKGRLKGLQVAFVGDGNNVANSLCLACAMLGVQFRAASPRGFQSPSQVALRANDLARQSGAQVSFLIDPRAAVRGADVVYTDVWTSMGQEAEAERRRQAFAAYQVNEELLALAKPDAIVMHDLPAHRGEEITGEAIEGPQSVVFHQAENRLHAQKAVLVTLLAR
ncbi:MAG: ornithine carbamoyltransferase [Chloroflexi bacterium]|nr:ornithine carbamoyltransferase [Chloroflexota bacterium]